MYPTRNARGGINKVSNNEAQGITAAGSTGLGGVETVAPTTPVPPIQDTSVPVDVMENGVKTNNFPIPEVDETFVNSTIETAQNFTQNQQANFQEQQNKEQTQTDSVRQLMDAVGGRSTERINAIDEAGILEQQKQLADLTSNISLNTDRLAQFDDQTFLGEEALRGELAGRDVTSGAFSAKARERRLQRAIDRTGRAASLRTQIATAELLQNNITAATAQIDAALEAKYAPLEQQLENEKFFLQRQFQRTDGAEQRVWQAKQMEVQEQLNVIKDAKNMVLDAMPYATPDELKQINDPKLSPEDQYKAAQAVVARGLREDRLQEQSIRNLDYRIKQEELNQLIDEGKGALVVDQAASLMTDASTPSSIRSYISSVLASPDIPNTVRSEIGASLDLSNSIERFVAGNPEGGFAGLGMGYGGSNFIGKPLTWMFASEAWKEEITENRSFVSSLDLKVQQWASGASLTEQQTEQVQKMIPQADDSDAQVRRKLNNLYNFMNGINQSKIQLSGINVNIPEVDLFELGDLVSGMSPEQRAEFEDAIEANSYQTSTPAYVN